MTEQQEGGVLYTTRVLDDEPNIYQTRRPKVFRFDIHQMQSMHVQPFGAYERH